MFLSLFHVQGHCYWHDIAYDNYEPYVPSSGVDPVDFYVWGLSEGWVRRKYEGGYSSRKDSEFTEIKSVTRVQSVPDGAECENTGSLREWHHQVKFSAPRWTAFFLRPQY